MCINNVAFVLKGLGHITVNNSVIAAKQQKNSCAIAWQWSLSLCKYFCFQRFWRPNGGCHHDSIAVCGHSPLDFCACADGSMIIMSYFCKAKAALYPWSIDFIKRQCCNQFVTQLFLFLSFMILELYASVAIEHNRKNFDNKFSE